MQKMELNLGFLPAFEQSNPFCLLLLETLDVTSKGVHIQLYCQATAYDLLSSKAARQISPIFIPSKGRAAIVHLNYDVPHALEGYKHVIVVVINENEVSGKISIRKPPTLCRNPL